MITQIKGFLMAIEIFGLKWKDGFSCSKCSCNEYWSVSKSKPYHRACKSCRHIQSPASNTLFNKVKFGLRKAFKIVFEVSGTTKGYSSSMIAERYEINIKSVWKFLQKIRIAMQSSGTNLLEGNCQVDEFFVGEYEENKAGRSSDKKKMAVIAIEKSGKFGIKRVYACKADNGSYLNDIAIFHTILIPVKVFRN
jgi:hypothetical protein